MAEQCTLYISNITKEAMATQSGPTPYQMDVWQFPYVDPFATVGVDVEFYKGSHDEDDGAEQYYGFGYNVASTALDVYATSTDQSVHWLSVRSMGGTAPGYCVVAIASNTTIPGATASTLQWYPISGVTTASPQAHTPPDYRIGSVSTNGMAMAFAVVDLIQILDVTNRATYFDAIVQNTLTSDQRDVLYVALRTAMAFANKESTWMTQSWDTIGSLALSSVCMPATHDSGMSQLSISTSGSDACNTQTQYETILQQLQSGARYFDFRPALWNNLRTARRGLIVVFAASRGKKRHIEEHTMKGALLALAIIAIGALSGAPMAATVAADPTSTSYQQGAADRDTWENWFNNLQGSEWEGADYWAGHRSLKAPAPCSANASNGADWLNGCIAAKKRLGPSDIRRMADPQYRNGWNKVGATIPNKPVHTSDPNFHHPGWLGVRIQSMTPELAESIGTTNIAGVMVADVTGGSPAEKAQIRRGDVIVNFNRQGIPDISVLPRVVAEADAGKQVEIVLWRDGHTITVTATLSERPPEESQPNTQTGAVQASPPNNTQLSHPPLSSSDGTVYAGKGPGLPLLGLSGGALICPSVDAVLLAIDRIQHDALLRRMPLAFRQMEEAQHGKHFYFVPGDIGCVIAPGGAQLTANRVPGIPMMLRVTGDLPDGNHVDGYTPFWSVTTHPGG